MTQTVEKRNHVNLEFIFINFDDSQKENLNYRSMNEKDKRFKFFKGNYRNLIEMDLYYNSDNCKNETYKIGWHPKSYPKNWLDVQKMQNLAARKALKTRATILNLAQFREKFKSQNAVILEDFIVIPDEEFLDNFYENPGNHWKTIKKSLEKENLNEKQKGSSFTYLFMLHAIAVDTTVYLIKDLEKTPENAQKIRNYLFSCTLHVLLLEQLLPKQASKENNQKFFLTIVRQKLQYGIRQAIAYTKMFKDLEHFFKACMNYYVSKKSTLLLQKENLNAIDFRFQRYLVEFQQDMQHDTYLLDVNSQQNMQQNIYLHPFLNAVGTKSRGIDFLRTAIEFPDFPDRTYPKNMFSSLNEIITASKDNGITGNKKNYIKAFSDYSEFAKTLTETASSLCQRCIIVTSLMDEGGIVIWNSCKSALFAYEKQLKANEPREALNNTYKNLIIRICVTIDTVISYSYLYIREYKINAESHDMLSYVIDVLLINLCIIEEMLPLNAGKGTIVLKLKNKCLSFFKFVLESGSEPIKRYFKTSLDRMLKENQAQIARGNLPCLSLANIGFIDLKYQRFLKDLDKYLEKHKQNPVN